MATKCLRCQQEHYIGEIQESDIADVRGNRGLAGILCQRHNVQQRRGHENNSAGWWNDTVMWHDLNGADHLTDWANVLEKARRNERINDDAEKDDSKGKGGEEGPDGRPDGEGHESESGGDGNDSNDEANGDGDGNEADGDDGPEMTEQQKQRQAVEEKLDEVYGKSYRQEQLEREKEKREKAEQKAKQEQEKRKEAEGSQRPADKIIVDNGAGERQEIPTDEKHFMFPLVLAYLSAGVHVYMKGPAGGGKTHMGQQLADALGRGFNFCGKLDSAYDLAGFVAADGVTVVPSAFSTAWDNGNLFLFDEFDRSDSKATVAYNAALANGIYTFPDGTRPMVDGFISVVGANTGGGGIDRNQQYVSAEQQDASTLDRFGYVPIPYDRYLEALLSGVTGKALLGIRKSRPAPRFIDVTPEEIESGEATEYLEAEVNSYVLDVQRWSNEAIATSNRHLISPRASIVGSKMLRRGVSRAWVEKSFVWKDLEAAQVEKITGEDRVTKLNDLIGHSEK